MRPVGTVRLVRTLDGQPYFSGVLGGGGEGMALQHFGSGGARQVHQGVVEVEPRCDRSEVTLLAG